MSQGESVVVSKNDIRCGRKRKSRKTGGSEPMRAWQESVYNSLVGTKTQNQTQRRAPAIPKSLTARPPIIGDIRVV